MLRAVLAVALATALLATALPAVESVRTDRTNALVADELNRLVSVASRLAATEDAVARGGGARWTVTLRFPVASIGTAGVRTVGIETQTAGQAVVFWRAEGGDRRRRHVTEVRLATADDEGIEWHSGGRREVTLSLVRSDGAPTVVVARPDV